MALAFGNGSRTVNFSGNQQRGQASFRPGMAQPIPPQSTGTPYGGPLNMGGGAYGVQQRGGAASPGYGGAAPAAQYSPAPAGGSRGQSPFQGIQPFTQTLNTPYGQMDPWQYYQQRDAFIQSANNQMSQYMPGGQSYGQPPQFSPQQMWGQAGQMVEQGWQNPYASQSMAPRNAGPVARPGGLIDIDSGFYIDQRGGGYQGQPGPGGAGQMDPNPPIPMVERGIRAWDDPRNPRGPNYDPSAEGRAGQSPPGRAGRDSEWAEPPPVSVGDWTHNPGVFGGRGGAERRGTTEASGYQSPQDWRAGHAARIASPANRRWLQSQSPANRRAYRALQGLY